jgi:hypothetical protein
MFRRLTPVIGIVLVFIGAGIGDEKEELSTLVKQLKDKDASIRLKAAKPC